MRIYARAGSHTAVSMPLTVYVLFVLPFQILFFPVWVTVKALERLIQR